MVVATLTLELAAMLRGVMLSSLFRVVGCVREVPMCDVRMVPSLHMVAGLMMLGGFTMVVSRLFMVVSR